MRTPNTRLQRTGLRLPLSRKPFGDRNRQRGDQIGFPACRRSGESARFASFSTVTRASSHRTSMLNRNGKWPAESGCLGYGWAVSASELRVIERIVSEN